MSHQTSDAPITQAEMIEMFGEAMPIEAVQLLWSAPDDWTLSDVRRELRKIAERPTPPNEPREE